MTAASAFWAAIMAAVPTKAEQARKWRFNWVSSCFGRSEVFMGFMFDIGGGACSKKPKSMQEKTTVIFLPSRRFDSQNRTWQSDAGENAECRRRAAKAS